MKTASRNTSGNLRRLGLAFLAGALLGLAFPKPGISLLAWIAPGALLCVAASNGGRDAFRVGFHGGLGFHLTALHWLLAIPMPLNAILGWLALSCVLALLLAGWCWVCWRVHPAPAGKQTITDRKARSVQWSLWFVLAAAAWVTMEMVVARIFSGFPWNLLGVAQFKFLPLIQLASITGVYGVSFVVAWVSITVVFTLFRLRGGRLAPGKAAVQVAPSLLVLSVVLLFGWNRLNSGSAPGGSHLKLALVQPAFPQQMIWNTNEKTNRFNALLDLSRRAIETQPDVLVWPESSLPDFFTRHNAVAIGEITQLAKSHNVWMVLGANDTRTRETNGVREVDFFNSAFLVNPAGQLANRYHKRQLVMFGEYMPLRDWFPFLKQFRGSGGGLAAGVRDVPFNLGPQGAQTSILICFEDVFPHLARRSVSPETDFLLNLTNDGWFGTGSAQWQHAATALFRAVENGVPLVRCANNGLTCWVDPRGRLHEVYFDDSRDIHQAGFKVAKLPLDNGKPRQLTFYTRYGDLFGWSCIAITALALLVRGFLSKKRLP